MKRRGFTLIELLVIIGVIAILIGILVPVVNRARDSANSVKCLSNLRQIGQAAVQYATDNGGLMLPAGYFYDNSSGANSENYATLLVNLKIFAAPSIANINATPVADATVFYCPAGIQDFFGSQYSNAPLSKPWPTSRTDPLGQRPWRTQSRMTGVIVDTWYGINADWNDADKYNAPAHFEPYVKKTTYSQNRLAGVKHSSDMVYLFDGIFYDLAYTPSSTQSGGNRINARHGRNRQTNLLFFDGHAETHDVSSIPGGADKGANPNPFSSVSELSKWPTMTRWRTDQK